MSTLVLMTGTMMMTMTITAMKSKAEVVEVWAPTGGSVLLNSGLQTKQLHQVRWTHKNLLVSSFHPSKYDRKHCELLSNGSLRLYHVALNDSGNYKLELFNSSGKLMYKKEFLLRVNDSSPSSTEHSAGHSAGHSAVTCCSLLLLLLFIPLCILRRRRMKKKQPISDQVYVEMHQSKISQKDGHDASCHSAVSTETDIYV